jgi:DNA recombination protein RmuC
MCIPIEPAYQAALEADPELLYLQAQAPVVITGPSTLMISLKLIAQIWRRENENRHAEKIADRAGRMHDQIALVYEAVADAQKRLGGTAEALDTAMKRIKDGRGSLLGRADELKQLGAKVSKTLPANFMDCD